MGAQSLGEFEHSVYLIIETTNDFAHSESPQSGTSLMKLLDPTNIDKKASLIFHWKRDSLNMKYWHFSFKYFCLLHIVTFYIVNIECTEGFYHKNSLGNLFGKGLGLKDAILFVIRKSISYIHTGYFIKRFCHNPMSRQQLFGLDHDDHDNLTFPAEEIPKTTSASSHLFA